MLGLGRGLLGDIGTGDVCQPGAVRLFHPGHVEREAEFPPAAQADPTGPAQGQAALPGPNSCGQQFLPPRSSSARRDHWVSWHSCRLQARHRSPSRFSSRSAPGRSSGNAPLWAPAPDRGSSRQATVPYIT